MFLIGKPDPAEGDTKIESLLEQFRLWQLSIEQLETLEVEREPVKFERLDPHFCTLVRNVQSLSEGLAG